MHAVSDPIENLIEDGELLQKLRQQLADLDAQRGRLQGQINACVARIAATAGRQVPPPANTSLALQILWVLRSHRDRDLSASDVAEKLSLTRQSELENIRVHLSRMRQRGWIKRVGHGRYQAFNE